jgi:hypothetical protein
MNTDQMVQGDVAQSVCDPRLALCRLLNEVRAAFGEMDELLERAERLISSRPRRSQFEVVLGGALVPPAVQGPP